MLLNKILLRNTARAWGLQASYLVNNHTPIWAPEKSLIKVLSDLTQTPIQSDADLKQLLEKRRAKYIEDGVVKSVVCWGGRPQTLTLYFAKGQKLMNLSAEIRLEDGSLQELPLQVISELSMKTHERLQVRWEKTLPLGYHQLTIKSNTRTLTTLIISAPEKLETAPELRNSWGAFVPLYALRTGQEWGIGSLKEMKQALETCAEYGAQWLGTLPLLAVNLDPVDCDPSPYSALTRLFWNEIFLDVDALIEKYNHAEARALVKAPDFQKQLTQLRESTHVDYHRVYKLKKQALKLLSESFFTHSLHTKSAYLNFVADNSEIDAYAKFRSSDLSEQNFHRFVQFEMNESLRELSETLPQGLYLDFPVGVNDAGFDFREFKPVFFKEVSVGAPPEEVFQQGQDWGFPAFNPFTHQAEGYQYLRKSLRNHLKYCKILRMDHVMGLYRVFTIPKGWTAHDGIYMRFPKEDLFAISMLEASKAKADIVGENLGTVPAAVDELIHKRNINGMWVLQLESWRKPTEAFDRVPPNAMISFNNHDLPMWASFMKGTDLDLVCKLNILKDESRVKFQGERKSQIAAWNDYTAPENITVKLHENLAKSKGKYFVATIEDFWNEEAPQNIPGTWKEYPNWRRKYSLPISQWTENKQAKAIFDVLKKHRGLKA
ncbi:4-alpha-glucanotransferase [Bdellovibrio sp. HCB337]|uniref:4-alpha-glucanotransferase n=1 Tax=Bdellovibrio sp. HCB337 TaxID=3394358 RepID=UPI0039A4A9C8